MKNYSDLQDIDPCLKFRLELEPVGYPEISVIVGDQCAGGKIFKPISLDLSLNRYQPFWVQIELKNKQYNIDNETAIKITKMAIDNIDLIPRFDYMASYVNDHSNNNPTSYLGFNGKWTLTFDRPFYQWLHQATGQGWLLS